MFIPVEERNKSNLLYRRLRAIKDSMMGRCYNKNNSKYLAYGARGVRVDEKWHKLAGFLDDIDSIDGWDEELFLAGKLRLDKDKKSRDNLLYSKDTCSWISPQENSKYKPSAQRKIHAKSPEGHFYSFYNQTDFAKEHGLDRPGIHACVHKKRIHHMGWQFWFDGDKEPKPRTVYQASKGEHVVTCFSIAELADTLNISRNRVYHAYRPDRSSMVDGYTITKHKQ